MAKYIYISLVDLKDILYDSKTGLIKNHKQPTHLNFFKTIFPKEFFKDFTTLMGNDSRVSRIMAGTSNEKKFSDNIIQLLLADVKKDLIARITQNFITILSPSEYTSIEFINCFKELVDNAFKKANIDEEIFDLLKNQVELSNTIEEQAKSLVYISLYALLQSRFKEIISIFSQSGSKAAFKQRIINSITTQYINNNMNVRTDFDYHIQITDSFDSNFISSKYSALNQTLTYTKLFFNTSMPNKFKIGFIFSTENLDGCMKEDDYFFRENFNIREEDIEILNKMTEQELQQFYKKEMNVTICINTKFPTLESVTIDENGIYGVYICENDDNVNETNTMLSFTMPYITNNNFFIVSFPDLTDSPNVTFEYPSHINISIIPFLNKEVSANNLSLIPNKIILRMSDCWITPVSGIVFIINNKN